METKSYGGSRKSTLPLYSEGGGGETVEEEAAGGGAAVAQ
jgi:hypothetical protein